MKNVLLSLVTLLAVANPALAKDGHGGGGGNQILTRGSQAWFLGESLEHSVRGLVATKVITEANLTSAQVNLNTTTNSSVALKTNVGPMQDECVMYDHWSHHGTILKKEVRCQKSPYYADNYNLTRGSDAWAVVEGMEHSLRLAVVSDASVLESTQAGESVLLPDSSVEVRLQLKGGRELRYRCLRQYYGQPDPSSINCALQQ